MRRVLRVGGKRLAENLDRIIYPNQHQSDEHTHIGFPSMHANAEGNSDEREAKAREGEGYLFVNLDANRFGEIDRRAFEKLLFFRLITIRTGAQGKGRTDTALPKFILQLIKRHIADAHAALAGT